METDALTSTYPPPPPYYRLYKDEAEQSPQDVIPPSPPPPPPEYCVFGTTRQKGDEDDLEEPSLPATPLFPPEHHDRKVELKKQCSSLLLSFYHLLDVLVHDQDSFYVKTADIELLLQNITYLLNTFRPHQARQAILQVFREQMETKSECVSEAWNFHKQYRQVSAELVSVTRKIHEENAEKNSNSSSTTSSNGNGEDNMSGNTEKGGREGGKSLSDLDTVLSALQEAVETHHEMTG